MKYCPQCGNETQELYEGYCEDCRNQNQSELNEHNAQFDFWEGLTDAERDIYIKGARPLGGG